MGTPLGPKYIPYTYMDPLGIVLVEDFGSGGALSNTTHMAVKPQPPAQQNPNPHPVTPQCGFRVYKGLGYQAQCTNPSPRSPSFRHIVHMKSDMNPNTSAIGNSRSRRHVTLS